MSEDAAEGLGADVAFADMGVAIHVGAARKLTVVGVKDMDVGYAEDVFGGAKGGTQSGNGNDIEASGEQVTGIEAVTDGEIGELGGEIADGAEFLEFAAQMAAGAGCVFQQDGQLVGRQAVGGVVESEGEGGDAFLHGVAAVTAWVDHQIFSADGDGALQFAAEGIDGFRPDYRVERCEVDQIVGVDDERREAETLAGGAQELDLQGVGNAGAPHAGTGGEDLEGGGSQIGRRECRGFQRSGSESVDAEAQAFMLAEASLAEVSVEGVEKNVMLKSLWPKG